MFTGGFRPGALNQLWGVVRPECVIATSGHGPGACQLFSYLDLSMPPLCIPGGMVLAGWTPPNEARPLYAPVPPSTKSMVAVDSVFLERLIDETFHFHDGTVACLRQHGNLRPWVHVLFATQVMHFSSRERTGQMSQMNGNLVDALVRSGDSNFDTATKAVTQLHQWSQMIQSRFDADNMCRALPTANQGSDQVCCTRVVMSSPRANRVLGRMLPWVACSLAL